MAEREFQFVKTQLHGAAKSALRIVCRECKATEDFVQTNGRRLPPIAAAQHFRKRGWFVGGNSNADNCPSCLKAMKSKMNDWDRKIFDTVAAAVAEKQDKAMRANAVNGAVIEADTTRGLPKVVYAEDPAHPTREDKRIIFAKLQDVYLDEEKGYDAGWTDHRVSEDLGVPRAWVAAVRDENFGPAKDNADIREFLCRVALLEEEWTAAIKAVEESTKALAANVSWQQDIANRLKDVERLAKNVRGQVAAS